VIAALALKQIHCAMVAARAVQVTPYIFLHF